MNSIEFFERAIVVFPKFENLNKIQQIREKYDPLATKIAPHITLVFPFKSKITSQTLLNHINQVLREVRFEPFPIQLEGITIEPDNYLFLNITKGLDQINRLHDLLYSRLLAQYLSKIITYKPHLTLGKFSSEKQLLRAYNELKDFKEEFTTQIDELVVEIIDLNLNSQTEHIISLS